MRRRTYHAIKLRIRKAPKRRKRNRKERKQKLDNNIFLETLTMSIMEFAKTYGIE